jgi:hypothetical protein
MCGIPMTNARTIMAIAVLLVELGNIPSAAAQDRSTTSPQIELSTDRSAYRLFEKVVLTVRVTNAGRQPQQYNALAAIGGRLRYRITGPDGNTVRMYSGLADVVGEYAPESEASATPPGSTKTGSIVLSHYYPVTASAGTYLVEVGIQLQGVEDPFAGDIGSVELQVITSGDTELVREVLEPFGRAVAVIRGNEFVDSAVLAALEAVAKRDDGSLGYLSESVAFYIAAFDLKLAQHGQDLVPADRRVDLSDRRPLEQAIWEFEGFLADYPSSEMADYARAALRTARRVQRERRPIHER